MGIDIVNVLSAFMILFAVIDITGSIPIILDLKKKSGHIAAFKATIVAFGIMLAFLFLGERLLGVFGVDIESFAIAGAFVMFLIGLEMVMGVEFFKYDTPGGASIVPIAFPLIAGAGSITSVISLKAVYSNLEITSALILNMIVVFVVLKSTHLVEKLLGETGIYILKKIFGVILLAISVKLFLDNTGIDLKNVG
ncbi:MAG: MarC family protein [Bacteroidales bacterium]|jgi:multiple antibiotic resistance protein|nr:MarC family protein [Bacteroidales bacterium]